MLTHHISRNPGIGKSFFPEAEMGGLVKPSSSMDRTLHSFCVQRGKTKTAGQRKCFLDQAASRQCQANMMGRSNHRAYQVPLLSALSWRRSGCTPPSTGIRNTRHFRSPFLIILLAGPGGLLMSAFCCSRSFVLLLTCLTFQPPFSTAS